VIAATIDALEQSTAPVGLGCSLFGTSPAATKGHGARHEDVEAETNKDETYGASDVGATFWLVRKERAPAHEHDQTQEAQPR
jgi:hypothetical protein